jgi:hypothetical protein
MKLVHKGATLPEYPVMRCTRCGTDVQQIDVPPLQRCPDPEDFVCLACLFPTDAAA